MANKRFWVGILVMVLLFWMALIGCDNGTTGGGGGFSTLVPSWAQGTWYTASSGAGRIKVAQITSSQYISFQVTGYDGSYNPIVSEMMRLDCTSVNGDTVEFGGTGSNALQVKKQGSDISMGTGGVWLTLYK
jgi:hypothetical protein